MTEQVKYAKLNIVIVFNLNLGKTYDSVIEHFLNMKNFCFYKSTI